MFCRKLIPLLIIFGGWLAFSATAARAAGARDGAPVTTGQYPLFSEPLNRPVPPAASTTQRGYVLRPSGAPQSRSVPTKQSR